MANATPSRLGQINQAGDNLALFLKVFAGEVLTTFNREAYFRDKQNARTIPSGKSAQFPVQGITTSYIHNPGDEILGNKVSANERVIYIEGLNVAPIFIPNIDEAMNHYDVRSIYGNDISQALSKLYDGNLSRVIANAARITTPNVKGVFPGDTLASTQVNAAYATDGPTLFNGIYDAGVQLDVRDVPMDGRFATVRPTQYALLIKSEKPFDYRLNDGQTGLGGYAEGKIRMISGIPVGKTNNYVSSNDVGNALLPTSRQHDYSTSQALVHHRSAAGTVALQDVTMEAEYDMRRQGWLMLGKYLCGHDYLRPEAAYELQSAAPAG
jgi:hypothetical protein